MSIVCYFSKVVYLQAKRKGIQSFLEVEIKKKLPHNRLSTSNGQNLSALAMYVKKRAYNLSQTFSRLSLEVSSLCGYVIYLMFYFISYNYLRYTWGLDFSMGYDRIWDI